LYFIICFGCDGTREISNVEARLEYRTIILIGQYIIQRCAIIHPVGRYMEEEKILWLVY